jgi:membrane protein DedA with SNARE-associated domain
MQSEITIYIIKYGYLAVFILVFLQEIGFPNPVPNEFILMFTGYLCFTGTLNFIIVIITAVSADVIGSQILYGLFYFAGNYMLKRKPRWVPIKLINKLKHKIETKGNRAIYIGRITPFLRGYTAVIVGLLQIKQKVFLPIVLISAIIYNGMYLLIGYITGPYWKTFAYRMGGVMFIIFIILLMILFVFIIKYMLNNKSERLG